MKFYQRQRRMRLLLPCCSLIALLPILSRATRSQTPSQKKDSECRTYAVRRIEFIGNDNTRDRIVRRRITFSEGKRLTDKGVEQTIKSLSRLKRLEKLKREDIEITYAVADPATPDWHCFADILIHVKEKKKR